MCCILSHNGSTAAILTYPTMVFYFWLASHVLWNDLRGIFIKQRHWQTFWGIIHAVYLCFHPLPVPMAARITKYLNKYVRRGLCLIYISSFYFWSPPLARKSQAILETGSGPKLSHNGCTASNFDLPDHGFLLLTCSTGPMEWSTGIRRFIYVFNPFRSPWRPE
jgi:hypothetical protein